MPMAWGRATNAADHTPDLSQELDRFTHRLRIHPEMPGDTSFIEPQPVQMHCLIGDLLIERLVPRFNSLPFYGGSSDYKSGLAHLRRD